MALSMEYPQTERVQSNVSTGEMWAQMAKPLFILLFICMWMTAAAELGPDQWFPSVMSALVPQLQGVLFLVYTAGLMFVLRTFGSSIAHKNPIGTLFVCSILTGIGLYWLGGLQPGTSALDGVRGVDGLRRRQELLLADDDRHHRRAVPARRRAAHLDHGRHRHAVGGGGAADTWARASTSSVRARRCRWSLSSAPSSRSSSVCSMPGSRRAVATARWS